MYASINGKTLVTIRDEKGLFHAVEIQSPGFESEADALRESISRILYTTETAETLANAKKLLDDDEYFMGKTNAQKAAILRAAKVLGRTVWLHVRRDNGDLEYLDYEVRIIGTDKVGLRNEDTGKAEILRYEQIEGGYTNDPGTNE